MYSCLFGGDDLVFDILVVVGSPTCRTQAVHVVLYVVVAELTYLVAARTRLEALVGEIELFDTQRAGLLFVIVEYERVLLHAFGHGGCGVTRAEGSGGV